MNRRDFLTLSSISLLSSASLANYPVNGIIVEKDPIQDDDEIHLDYNENPYGPFPAALKEMHKLSVSYGRYDEVYSPRLEADIREKFNLKNLSLILSPGSSYLLNIIPVFLKEICNTVIYQNITFDLLVKAAKHVGYNEIIINDDINGGIDIDNIVNKDIRNCLIYLCNPNNPTGTVINHDKFFLFCQKMSKNNVIVIDEAYIEYTNHKSCLSFIEHNGFDNIIVSRTFSKIFGMAGMRLGYFMMSKNLEKYFDTEIFHQIMPTSASFGALISLFDEDEILKRKQETEKLRNQLVSFFRDRSIIHYKPSANFIYFKPPVDMTHFVEGMSRYNIKLSRIWPQKPDFIRVTIGKSYEMDYFMKVFDILIDKYMQWRLS
ncbi:histidinol-phosphate transaminase [Xenorhabdus nematophila]|uniref:pyridoxal phosphate-dependent aminotransferase n=1 Tax=Xenorhabdus nematophila TaxID=628 RepID=UPI00054283A5|nr:putative Histidinol-phosphate transaminase [Xenorhabdus nematophila str. Anatoliense]CEE95498.1 putative Histidinol-phosphate transaminase [Xenorhabdus nematophila str. Anatoliense]